jgi:hypothetical protein
MPGIPHLLPVLVLVPVAFSIVIAITIMVIACLLIVDFVVIVKSPPHIPHVPNFHVRPILAEIERFYLDWAKEGRP